MIYNFLKKSLFRKGIGLLDRYVFAGSSQLLRFAVTKYNIIFWPLFWLLSNNKEEEREEIPESNEKTFIKRIVYGSRWVNTSCVSVCKDYTTSRALKVIYLVTNNFVSGIDPNIIMQFKQKEIEININNPRSYPKNIALAYDAYDQKIQGNLTKISFAVSDSSVLTEINAQRGNTKIMHAGDLHFYSRKDHPTSLIFCDITFSDNIIDIEEKSFLLPRLMVKTENSIVFDCRNDNYVVSNNTTLCILDFMLHALNIPITMIDLPSFSHAADICDEKNTLHKAIFSNFYCCDALIILTDNIMYNLAHLLHTMLGDLYMEDGKIKIRAGSIYKVRDYTHVITKNLCNEGISIDTLSEDIVESDFVLNVSYIDEDMNEVDLSPIVVEIDLLNIASYIKKVHSSRADEFFVKHTPSEYDKYLPDMRNSNYRIEQYQVENSFNIPSWQEWFKPKARSEDALFFELFLPFVSTAKQAHVLARYYARMLVFRRYKFYIDVRIDEHIYTFDSSYKIRLPFFSKAYNFILEAKEYNIKSHSMRLTLRLDHEAIWNNISQADVDYMLKIDKQQKATTVFRLFPPDYHKEVIEILSLNQDNTTSAYGHNQDVHYSDMEHESFIKNMIGSREKLADMAKKIEEELSLDD